MLLKSDIAWAKVILHSEKKTPLKLSNSKRKRKQKNAVNILVRPVGWGRGWGGVGTDMGLGETSRAYNKMVMAQ